jgi:TfoX/Sxy family transcriptional regulator of competence genes
MAYDEALADRVRAALDGVDDVAELRMFGGLCHTVHGNMAVGVIREDLLVRLAPDEAETEIGRPGVRAMEVGGRTSRGFLSVGPEATATDEALRAWVERGVAYASSLPAKPPKPPKPKPRKPKAQEPAKR